MARSVTIVPRGAFNLRESAEFGFGQRMRPAGVGAREGAFDGVMRLAFCLDGSWQPVGVELRQDDAGVHTVVHGDGDLRAVEAQVARVLSLDHDATGYDELGTRDAVIGRLQAAAPGLRPPLFHSPYEAAAWAVLSARRPGWQMDRVRAALAEAHGTVYELAGERLAAFPSPEALLAVEDSPGVDAARLERLHGVAQAAAAGVLDVAELRALEPAEALDRVCTVKGIGPFYGNLVVLRALGHTDVLPTTETHVLRTAGELYDLGAPATPEQFERIAEPWRPWRTWCAVLLRAGSGRLAS